MKPVRTLHKFSVVKSLKQYYAVEYWGIPSPHETAKDPHGQVIAKEDHIPGKMHRYNPTPANM